MGNSQRSFRSDINGLRAWAVVAVILYHFKVGGFGGGYVGVDIFFVISGFLMTGIIARALQNGAADAPMSFLWNFFLARGKRILPALIVVCLLLLVLGYFTLSGQEFKDLGDQTRSAVLFFSNIKFWRETDYFAAASQSIWLLHTWSLSVEWQFYVILPVALLVAWKIRPAPGTLLVALAAGGALSLGLGLFMVSYKPTTAFFLLPFRAWEMVAGGLVALAAPRPPQSTAVRHGLETGGLALITYCILAYGHMPWPGLHAVAPVLGTVMVLLAAKENSLLTNWAPLRWIGTRSYSMYLWHWPLVVGLFYFGNPRDPVSIVGGLLLTLLLGHLSYELIETRARQPLEGMRRTGSSAALVLASLMVVVPASVIFAMKGLPGRLPTDVASMFESTKDRDTFSPKCEILKNGDDRDCATPGSKLGLIVIGDSHAEAVFAAAVKSLPRKDLQATRWTLGGCGTMSGLKLTFAPERGCDKFLAWALKRLESVPETVPVLIVNRTSGYFEGKNEDLMDEDPTVPFTFFTKQYSSRSPEFYREMKQRMIDTTCQIAKHRRVYMLRPIPEMRVDVPNVVGRAMLLGKPVDLGVSMSDYAKRHATSLAAQNEARDRCGVVLLDPLPYLCEADRCSAVVKNRAMYYDDDHLSLHGASHLTPMFATMFQSGAPLPHPRPSGGAQTAVAP